MCLDVKERFPQFFKGCSVLDVGSLDINGANRYLFDSCTYAGIDVAAGKNVDIVSVFHEFTPPGFIYDTIISTECLEHDKFWRKSLVHMVDLIRPRGFLLVTCATHGREEHGTNRSKPHHSPLTVARGDDWGDYYQNLDEGNIREVLDVNKIFSQYGFEIDNTHHDLLFWGIKR
jgi:hypothetical protein